MLGSRQSYDTLYSESPGSNNPHYSHIAILPMEQCLTCSSFVREIVSMSAVCIFDFNWLDARQHAGRFSRMLLLQTSKSTRTQHLHLQHKKQRTSPKRRHAASFLVARHPASQLPAGSPRTFHETSSPRIRLCATNSSEMTLLAANCVPAVESPDQAPSSRK
jgi:hypothetical protein